MKNIIVNKNNGEIKDTQFLGPISSLEVFVSPNRWRKIFNSFYLKTDRDVIEDYKNPKLLEVNPIPEWCWDGHLTKMAGYAGLSYKEMLATILEW